MKILLKINLFLFTSSSKKLIFVFILLLLLPLTGCKSVVKETVVEEPVRIEIVEPKPERGFCYSDPNNSHWYLAKTADEPGWSSGDSCYTPSGSVTPFGGQSCIGGSGLTSCISACETAGINCN